VGYVTSNDNIQLQYTLVHPDELSREGIKTIFFLQGWAESAVKYADLILDLTALNFTVVTFDYRSQGKSGRGDRLFHHGVHKVTTHFENFEDMVNDALQVYQKVIHPLNSTNLTILGFSMGGLIAVHLSKRLQNDSLILISPLLCPFTGNIPSWVFQAVTTLARFAGKGQNALPGRKVRTDHRLPLPPKSIVSSSSSRIQYWEQLRREDPDLCMNGMSIGQANELLKFRITPEHASGILSGRVLLMSSEIESFVDNRGVEVFCKYLPASVPLRRLHFLKSKHELLHERDEIRDKVIEEITMFLERSQVVQENVVSRL
jgi:lysophospholipase